MHFYQSYQSCLQEKICRRLSLVSKLLLEVDLGKYIDMLVKEFVCFMFLAWRICCFHDKNFLDVIQFSGARRLRDAIVLGYQLQRVADRDISIPDWYICAEHEIGQSTTPKSLLSTSSSMDNLWVPVLALRFAVYYLVVWLVSKFSWPFSYPL